MPISNIIRKDLVLVGGGHSHVEVLRQLAMQPVAGLRVSMVSRDMQTPYSGMLPGFVAGYYTWEDIHIDLVPLCARAGARLITGVVGSLNLEDKYVECGGRPPIRYDLLSINSGSAPAIGEIDGADRIGIPVKPLDQFLPHWQSLLQRLHEKDDEVHHLLVVGGGAGGVELALSMRHRLSTVESFSNVEIELATADRELLIDHGPGVRERLQKKLAKAGVRVRLGTRVTAAERTRVRTDAGENIRADSVLWVTQAAAPTWPAAAGLAVDGRGFIRVNDCLRSASHADVFAAGDVAVIDGEPRPKSGVFAVRQGPALARNLRRAACGQPLRPFRPQRNFLSLISTGDRRAVASRAGFGAQGRWLWAVKNWIDHRFMDKYKVDAEPMQTAATRWSVPSTGEPGSDSDDMRCGGCGAKLGGDLLARVLQRLHVSVPSEVVAGIGDDAAVLRPIVNTLEVHTVDGFRTMLDDPFLLGRIAAEHSINDVYAMGGLPRTALVWAQVPYAGEQQMEDDLFQLMAGTLRGLDDAGAALVGGHSGEAAELSIGVAISGTVHERDIWQNSRIVPGHYLILTKPLGTGILLAANMRARCRGAWLAAAIDNMCQSNRKAVAIFKKARVKACTDISGFGLLGHTGQLVLAANLSVEIWPEAIPLLSGVAESLQAGTVSSLQEPNEQALAAVDLGNFDAGAVRVRVLFDPQTSGGLLAAVKEEHVEACLSDLNAAGFDEAAVVGRVRAARDDGHWAMLREL